MTVCWQHNVLRQSVTLCMLAKRYVLQQKCLDKWIGSAPRNVILQLPTLYTHHIPSNFPPAKVRNFAYVLYLALLFIDWVCMKQHKPIKTYGKYRNTKIQCIKNYRIKSDSILFKRRPNTTLHRVRVHYNVTILFMLIWKLLKSWESIVIVLTIGVRSAISQQQLGLLFQLAVQSSDAVCYWRSDVHTEQLLTYILNCYVT